MRRAYQTILKLYPYDFRAAFAAEMLAVLDTLDAKRGVELASVPVPANGTATRAIPETKPNPAAINNRIVRQAFLWE